MTTELTDKQRAAIKELIVGIDNGDVLDGTNSLFARLKEIGITEQQFEEIYELDAFGQEW